MSASDYQPPPAQPLRVLYANTELLIVDKPAGLLSVPGRGAEKADCLIHRAHKEFPTAMIVHRLDMATSGILALALNPDMQRELSILFASRKVSKRYLALVDGLWSAAPEGQVDQPLIADWPQRPRQKIDHQIGRPSLTHYRLLALDTTQATSRLELQPITGRSHQLRVHMDFLGHPILGDSLYGTPRSQAKATRLMLHANYLEFIEPRSGQTLCVESPAPF